MSIRPTGPVPARIMIVGEAPGEMEMARGEPFVGSSGLELGKMLQEAGILRSACFLTNVCRIRPPANDIGAFVAQRKADITPQHGILRDKYCLPPVFEGLELLKREIEMVKPNVIIALGNLASWALTGNWGVMSWRGSTIECDLDLALDYKPKVLITHPPAMVMRQWSWRQIVINDLRRAAAHSKFREFNRPDYRFVIRPDFQTAFSHLKMLHELVAARPVKLSVDIETRAGHIACIGIAWSRREAICIPLMCVERKDGYWTAEEEALLMWQLYLILTSTNAQVIGQNFSYDAQYFHRHLHYVPRLTHDTMIAHHVCFSSMQKGLDFLSSMYCEHHEYWKDDGKTWDEKTGEDQLWRYNCQDAVITYEVEEVETRNITSMGLAEVNAFQQKMFWPVLKTMNRGLRVDHQRRAQFAMTLMDEIARREQWICEVLGHPVNIKSPKQMKELFYDALGQKPIISRKTGTVTCDDEALGKLSDREPILRPLIKKVQELRSLGVFLSTFVNAPLDLDGRIRCSFNIAGTETFRFSSSANAFGSGLNLQNIPKGGDVGDGLELPNVRSLFVPDPGNTFFDIDLSSADLRIVFWEADEPEAKALLKAGEDFYTMVGREFYRDPSMSKKDPRRNTFFKPFCHGTHYLGTAKGLAERLGISVHEAERTQKWYFGKFPRLKKWQDDLKDQVLKRRMVQNVFGYRTYFFDRIEGTVFNQAVAWIPQSTIGCLINRGYMNIYENLPWCEVLLQVHDSLAGQFPTHLGDWAVAEIVKAAEIPLPYDDPLTIPVGVKTSNISWGDCE